MLNDRIEAPWLAAFEQTLGLCGLVAGDCVAILQSLSPEIFFCNWQS